MQSMERARGASTALTRLNVHLCPLWKSANGIKASYLQLHSPRGGQTPGPEVWLARTRCCLVWHSSSAIASCLVPASNVCSLSTREIVCVLCFSTRRPNFPANLWPMTDMCPVMPVQ